MELSAWIDIRYFQIYTSRDMNEVQPISEKEQDALWKSAEAFLETYGIKGVQYISQLGAEWNVNIFEGKLILQEKPPFDYDNYDVRRVVFQDSPEGYLKATCDWVNKQNPDIANSNVYIVPQVEKIEDWWGYIQLFGNDMSATPPIRWGVGFDGQGYFISMDLIESEESLQV